MKAFLALFVIFALSQGIEASKSATASHILVEGEDACNNLKAEIESGSVKFEDAAKEHSKCPSGKSGGSLGNFGQGQMVPEFDKVIFDAATEMGKVYGPVKTQFGYHLIQVFKRSGVNGEESA